MASVDVNVIGELNLDLIFYRLPEKLELEREHLAKDLSITLGNSSAIFAHNLSLLGNRVGVSSCIGSDPFGEICIQRLGATGVDLSRVRRMAGKTTGLTIILPQRQQRYILTYPGTMYDLSERDLELRHIFDAKHLHVSSYFLHKALRPKLIGIFRKIRMMTRKILAGGHSALAKMRGYSAAQRKGSLQIRASGRRHTRGGHSLAESAPAGDQARTARCLGAGRQG